MNMLLTATRVFSRKHTVLHENTGITGNVERVALHEIAGWAVNPDQTPLQLTLRVNGRVFPMAVHWSERADIAEKYGAPFLTSGFRYETAEIVRDDMVRALQHGNSIEVLANNVVLRNIGVTDEVPAPPRKEELHSHIRTTGFEAELEAWGRFRITGWAVSSERAAGSFDVLCNGERIECVVLRKERRDVATTLQIAVPDTGFEIELPGYIWDGVAIDEPCVLEVLADGHSLTPTPLELSRARITAWSSEVMRMPDGKERQYDALLALEHARYSALITLLDPEDARLLREFAQRMHLEEYAVAPQLAHRYVERLPVDGASTLLLWEALRALNELVSDNGGSSYAHVKDVLNNLRLKGEVREEFIRSSVPVLCRSNELLALRELVDFSRLSRLEHAEELWKMSLALPALVADRQIDRSIALCYRLSKHVGGGWLNTECLRFATAQMQVLSKEGEIDQALAEKFRYAVIAVIDGFNGGWFSRLHDVELVDTVLTLLADLALYTDYHQRDIVTAVLRNYGLNPTFWERAAACGVAELTPEMQRAQRHFGRIAAAVRGGGAELAAELEAVEESLSYFRNRDNREAVTMLREVCMNALPHIAAAPTAAGRTLLKQLLATEPAEALRVAAAPLPGAAAPVTGDPEACELLSRALRYESGRPASVVYELQCAAARAVQLAQQATDGREAARAVADLEQRAIAIAAARDQYLGVDMLAAAYALADGGPQGGASVLMRLGELMRKAIEDTAEGRWIPAPVLTALGRFMALPGDAVLRGFCAEVVSQVRARFGSRYDALLAPTSPSIALAAEGWPRDTLVVIYSCRKNLDSRVAAIRSTWVQDLVARGIPYVVLVGDGDDSLQDDVLALNVSDRYEDLPQKTLKLFDWIYRNTDAQYVIKIDDDCYLDVARYFDTLSYRKHHYYGRVIWRDVGSMERDWHQSKSHSLRGRRCIDKSPEPSVYADGGGAYCLSRLAISRLLAAKRTEQGARLLACSFMEDKLVGDLLSLSDIRPVDEDYESYQRRRTFGNATPVGMWENTFFPSTLTPTKVVHMDTERGLDLVRERARGDEIWPKKLWPTCWPPSIKPDGNQLELIGDPQAAAPLLQQSLLVVTVVRNEMIMLPHFLAHYRALGVRCFVFVDNCSDDGTREYLQQQPDVVLYSSDTEYKKSHYGVAWQQAVLGNLCLGKWALLVDADELLVFDGCEQRTLQEFVAEAEAEGADAVSTYMIDMYPYGDLAEADLAAMTPFEAAPWFDAAPLISWRLGSGMYGNGATWLSTLRHRLSNPSAPNAFTSQKTTLVRYQPWMRFSQGLHDASNVRRSAQPAWLAHFKYHAGFKDKVHTEVRRGQHYNNAAEYRRYMVMLAEGQGGFGAADLSQRYEGSGSFAAIQNHVSKR
jgi:glycosyltransferase involved in cell wall biosynthesis